MPQRTLLSLTSFSKDIEILDQPISLGRGDVCTTRIACTHISGVHCHIEPSPRGVSVRDNNSKNGTYVNGRRVAKNTSVSLKNGDYVSLTPPGDHGASKVCFIFKDDSVMKDRKSVFENVINEKDIQIVKRLGKGAFGEVFLGVVKQQERAIKVVNSRASGPTLYREIQVMDRLRHPNIVCIHEVLDAGSHFCMTLDYASGGDLEGLLRQMGQIKESDARSILVQVLGALKYLHAENVIHRDLKPENILIKDPVTNSTAPHLMLSDFGLAAILTNPSLPRASTVCGTPYYAAPEIVLADRAATTGGKVEPYDPRVDIWSTGVLLFRMLCGRLPWDDGNKRLGLADKILAAADPAKPIRLDDVEVSRLCRHFIERLLVRKEERLDAADALEHEWFAHARSDNLPKENSSSMTQVLVEDDMELSERSRPNHNEDPPPYNSTKRIRSA